MLRAGAGRRFVLGAAARRSLTYLSSLRAAAPPKSMDVDNVVFIVLMDVEEVGQTSHIGGLLWRP